MYLVEGLSNSVIGDIFCITGLTVIKLPPASLLIYMNSVPLEIPRLSMKYSDTTVVVMVRIIRVDVVAVRNAIVDVTVIVRTVGVAVPAMI